jgi:hypothetical protein
MTKKVTTLAIGVVVVVAWACQGNTVVYDGFETPGLSEYWETRRCLPGAVQMQSTSRWAYTAIVGRNR